MKCIRLAKPVAQSSSWTNSSDWDRIPLLHSERSYDAADAARRVIFFHVQFREGVQRGYKVSYLGEDYIVARVQSSSRLRGLELMCIPLQPTSSVSTSA